MNLVAALKLALSESAFLKAELKHIEAKRTDGETYQSSREFEPEARSRIQAKRRNLLKSLLWITILVISGGSIASLINVVCPSTMLSIRLVRAVSVVCLAWAVWSKFGDVETWEQQTLLELTSQYLYKMLYSLGIFMGSLALFLEGPGGA